MGECCIHSLHWFQLSEVRIFVKQIAILVCFLLFSSAAHCVAAPDEISVYIAGEPATDTLAQSRAVLPSIIQLVAEESGLNLVPRPLPWRRAQMMAENGTGLLFGAAITPERAQKFHFTRSLGTISQWLISTEEKPIAFREWSDLKGMVVSSLSGAKYSAAFEDHRDKSFSVEENATSLESQLAMLRARRVDAVVVASLLDGPGLERRLNCVFPIGAKLVVIGRPFESAPLMFAVPKASPAATQLSVLNAAISRIARTQKLQGLSGTKNGKSQCAPS